MKITTVECFESLLRDKFGKFPSFEPLIVPLVKHGRILYTAKKNRSLDGYHNTLHGFPGGFQFFYTRKHLRDAFPGHWAGLALTPGMVLDLLSLTNLPTDKIDVVEITPTHVKLRARPDNLVFIGAVAMKRTYVTITNAVRAKNDSN